MFRLILLFALSISQCFSYQYDLSICTIFRDEAPYLKEWIEFHRMLGVEHFYLCNHASKDNYQEVLQPYIDQGIVELKDLCNDKDANLGYFCFSIQIGFYNEIINKTKGVSKWIAFIDADEFLCPVEKKSLVGFLKEYEEFSCLSVNWLMFGTSNIPKLQSDKLMIEQLTSCAAIDNVYNTYLKCIIQPNLTINFPNPHFSIYISGYFGVDTDKNPLKPPFGHNIPIIDKLRLNHYWTRDEFYFCNTKIPRQIQLLGQIETAMKLHDEFLVEEDFTIQRFVPKLRKKMKLD